MTHSEDEIKEAIKSYERSSKILKPELEHVKNSLDSHNLFIDGVIAGLFTSLLATIIFDVVIQDFSEKTKLITYGVILIGFFTFWTMIFLRHRKIYKFYKEFTFLDETIEKEKSRLENLTNQKKQ